LWLLEWGVSGEINAEATKLEPLVEIGDFYLGLLKKQIAELKAQ